MADQQKVPEGKRERMFVPWQTLGLALLALFVFPWSILSTGRGLSSERALSLGALAHLWRYPEDHFWRLWSAPFVHSHLWHLVGAVLPFIFLGAYLEKRLSRAFLPLVWGGSFTGMAIGSLFIESSRAEIYGFGWLLAPLWGMWFALRWQRWTERPYFWQLGKLFQIFFSSHPGDARTGLSFVGLLALIYVALLTELNVFGIVASWLFSFVFTLFLHPTAEGFWKGAVQTCLRWSMYGLFASGLFFLPPELYQNWWRGGHPTNSTDQHFSDTSREDNKVLAEVLATSQGWKEWKGKHWQISYPFFWKATEQEGKVLLYDPFVPALELSIFVFEEMSPLAFLKMYLDSQRKMATVHDDPLEDRIFPTQKGNKVLGKRLELSLRSSPKGLWQRRIMDVVVWKKQLLVFVLTYRRDRLKRADFEVARKTLNSVVLLEED